MIRGDQPEVAVPTPATRRRAVDDERLVDAVCGVRTSRPTGALAFIRPPPGSLNTRTSRSVPSVLALHEQALPVAHVSGRRRDTRGAERALADLEGTLPEPAGPLDRPEAGRVDQSPERPYARMPSIEYSGAAASGRAGSASERAHRRDPRRVRGLGRPGVDAAPPSRAQGQTRSEWSCGNSRYCPDRDSIDCVSGTDRVAARAWSCALTGSRRRCSSDRRARATRRSRSGSASPTQRERRHGLRDRMVRQSGRDRGAGRWCAGRRCSARRQTAPPARAFGTTTPGAG